MNSLVRSPFSNQCPCKHRAANFIHVSNRPTRTMQYLTPQGCDVFCETVNVTNFCSQVDAVQMVKTTTASGETKYPIKAINVLKVSNLFVILPPEYRMLPCRKESALSRACCPLAHPLPGATGSWSRGPREPPHRGLRAQQHSGFAGLCSCSHTIR